MAPTKSLRSHTWNWWPQADMAKVETSQAAAQGWASCAGAPSMTLIEEVVGMIRVSSKAGRRVSLDPGRDRKLATNGPAGHPTGPSGSRGR
jgi:hypothetical protein